jgi:hypothetical protein
MCPRSSGSPDRPACPPAGSAADRRHAAEHPGDPLPARGARSRDGPNPDADGRRSPTSRRGRRLRDAAEKALAEVERWCSPPCLRPGGPRPRAPLRCPACEGATRGVRREQRPGRLGRPDAGRGCGPGPAGPRAMWSCSPRPAARRPPRALPAQGSEATWEWAGKSASHRRPRNCFAPAFAADSVEGARYVQRRRAKSVVPTNGWCIPRCLRRCLAHLRFAERVGETRTGGPSPAEKGIQVRRNSAARRTGSSLPRPTPEAPAPGRARPGRCRTRARTSVLWGGRPPCRCVGGGLATHRFGTARSPVSPRLCESTRVLPARGSSKAHQASSVGDAPSELPR